MVKRIGELLILACAIAFTLGGAQAAFAADQLAIGALLQAGSEDLQITPIQVGELEIDDIDTTIVYSFTAPEESMYRFNGTDNYGHVYTKLDVYTDAECENLLITNDGFNAAHHFLVDLSLSAGETVYLRPSYRDGWSGPFTLHVKAIDYNNITDWDHGNASGGEIYLNEVIEPKVGVYRYVAEYDAVVLEQGVDYEVTGYERWDESTESYVAVSEPDKEGYYNVTYTGKDDSGHFGEFTVRTYIRDCRDLANWSNLTYGEAHIEGGVYYADFEISLYRRSSDYRDFHLEQGKDFVISGYATYDSASSEYVDISGEPQEAGGYYAKLAPAEGSGYIGVLYVNITVISYDDLQWWGYSDTYTYIDAHGFHEPTFKLYRDKDGNRVYLKQGEDFAIVGYKQRVKQGSSYVYIEVDEPDEAGSYYAVLQAIDGAGVTGSREMSIVVQDYRDISSWRSYATGKDLLAGGFKEPTVRIYHDVGYYEDNDATFLKQGEDFVIVGYKKKVSSGSTTEYVDVDEPNEGGTFYAVVQTLAGAPTTGTCQVAFTVADYRDLSKWKTYSTQGSLLPEGFQAPVVHLYRTYEDYYNDKGNPQQGTDFEITNYEYKDDAGNYTAVAEPTKDGYYRVTVVAKEGSGYTGSLTAEVYVYDHRDLANCYASRSGQAYIEDGVFHLDVEFELYRLLTSIYERVYLEQGKDFVLAGYATYDSDTDTYVDLPGDPQESGEYYAKFVPAEGSGYIGTKYVDFEVDDHDELQWWICSGVHTSIDGAGFHAPTFTIYRERDGKTTYLEQGKDFAIVGYKQYSYDYYDYVDVDEPSEAGEYCVVLQALDGSLAKGTREAWLTVEDYCSLNKWSCAATEGYLLPEGFESPEFDVYREDLYTGEKFHLVQGADFVVIGYKYRKNGTGSYVTVDEPSEPGIYRAIIEPKEGSGYTDSLTAEVYVYDHRVISEVESEYSGKAYIEDGVFYSDIVFELYIWTLNDDVGSYLEQGKGFTIAGYAAHDSGTGEYVDLPGNPQKPGKYYAKLVFEKGSGFSGEVYASFDVVDFNELKWWDYHQYGAYIDAIGFHSPTFILFRIKGDKTLYLEQGKDFDIVGYKRWDDAADDYVGFTGDPQEPGCYCAVLQAKQGASASGVLEAEFYVWRHVENSVQLSIDTPVSIAIDEPYTVQILTYVVEKTGLYTFTSESNYSWAEAECYMDKTGTIDADTWEDGDGFVYYDLVKGQTVYLFVYNYDDDYADSTTVRVNFQGETEVTDADRETAQQVAKQIQELGTITLDKKDAVIAARAAYEKLSRAQKSLVPAERISELEAAETRIAELQAEADGQENDAEAQKAINSVVAKIDAIGAVTSADQQSVVAAARDAYNKLTADQKAAFPSDKLAALVAAEGKVAELVKAKAAAEKKTAALKASSVINKATVTASDVKKASSQGSASVTLGPKVKKIKKNAFKGTKITTVIIQTKKLKKSSVKNAFKGSKVKTVKVPSSKKKAYKKIFTKKVVGKKVKVK